MANSKIKSRLRRKKSIRKRVCGTTERPRLTVFRSNLHMYVQVVDDSKQHSLAAASTDQKSMAAEIASCESKVDQAKAVGRSIAKVCLDKGIRHVVFDRNGYQYHGRVSALADAAREAGLEF